MQPSYYGNYQITTYKLKQNGSRAVVLLDAERIAHHDDNLDEYYSA